MAKLPGVADLGATPTADAARPVATTDVSSLSRGAAALTAGGEALGKGIAKLGEGIGEYQIDKSRWEYAQASAGMTAELIGIRNKAKEDITHGPDDAGHDMPTRYGNEVAAAKSKWSATIADPNMRERFDNEIKPAEARETAFFQSRQRDLWQDGEKARGDEQRHDLIDKGVSAGDEETKEDAIRAINKSIDGAVAAGIYTQSEAAQLKRHSAEQFATADVLASINSGDPDRMVGALNALRRGPGSPEATVDRILHNEGTARNPKSSATGAGQFIDQTWLAMLRKERPDLAAGRGDEELLALRADRTLGRQMTAAYARDNAAFLVKQGVEATPGNVYLAHFLGPAGAAAVLKANPSMPVQDALAAAVGDKKAAAMVEANQSILGGQLAGSVVNWSSKKMGGGEIYEVLRPNPVLRERLIGDLEQGLHKRNAEELTGFKLRLQDTTAEAMTVGTVAKPMRLGEFVAALGADAGPKAHKQYQAQLQLGQDISKVAALDPDEQQKLLDRYAPTAGAEGFSDQVKRREQLQKAIVHEQSLRARDPDFKKQVDSSIAEAARTGKATNAISRDEFVRRFGKDDGDRAYASYSASLRLGRDAQNAGELSLEEQNALLKDYVPAPGSDDYVEASKRYDGLQKAIAQANKEKVADPAGFAIARLPVVSEAHAKLTDALSNPTAPLEAKQTAAREYVAKMEMEQARIDIPADQRRLLPKGYADRFNAMVSKPQAAGGSLNVAAAIENEARIWGDEWPKVYRQLAKGAMPVVTVIGSGVKPVAAQVLTEFANTKLGDIANDQSEEKLSTIRKDVRDKFRPLARSMVGNEGTQTSIDAFQASGEKLAAYYVRNGKSSIEAAAQAFDDLLGHKYDFGAGTYRVPKNISVTPDEVAAGLRAARAKLGEFDLELAKSRTPGLSETYLKEESVRRFARDGVWTTAPDESGLVLTYGDEYVSRRNGSPLLLTWAQLGELGREHNAKVRGARGIGVMP